MACRIQIKENLENEIAEKAKGIEGAQWKIAQQKAKEINNSYNFDVVKVFEGVTDYINKVVISIPEALVDLYHAYFTDLETKEAAAIQAEDSARMGEEFTDDYLFQIQDVPASTASPETIAKVKAAAKKMGIDIQKLADYLKGNPDVNAKGVNALADLIRGIVAISEGKEDVALTEEVVHIATAMLEQTHPQMITEMISKIGRFKIYDVTLQAYKNNPNYQLSNGKPDIRKIKKEAVDKLITELIINQNEGTTEFPELRDENNRSVIRQWWNNILDAIRGMYRKANISIFEEVAEKVISGEIEGEITEGGLYYQLSKPQEDFQKKIIETRESIKKVESKDSVDPMFLDTEEASNWYEILTSDGTYRKIKKRVTDRVKAWYNQRFYGKQFSPQEKEFNELKRTLGIKYHNFLQEIHSRYFSPEGEKKIKIGDRPYIADAVDREAYLKLEKYFTELVNSFSKDGKQPLVFSEVVVYDNKEDEAGTLDLLIVDESGKAHIFDWKFMSVSEKSEDIPWFKKGAFNIQLGRYKDILRKNYGVKEVGMNRAIPILMEFKRENIKIKNSPVVLKGLVVGSVNVNNIEDIRLLPVSEKTESTAVSLEDPKEAKALDDVLQQLNAVLTQIGKSTATTEEEKEFKARRLNVLERAIRIARAKLDITPLIEVIKELSKEGQMIINDYNTTYKDVPFDSKELTDEQLSDFAEQIREYTAITSVFENISVHLGDMIYTPQMEKDAKTLEERQYVAKLKQILNDIINEQQKISKSKKEINDISKDFADKFIGKRNFEVDLLTPEAVVKGLASTFRGVSELPLTALRILYRLVTNAKGKASKDSLDDAEKILAIKRRLIERGGDLRKLVQQLYQKGENKFVNKLIHKYNKDFYDGVKGNALEINRSKQWLMDNIDMEAYKKEATEIMERNIAHYKSRYSNDELTLESMIKEERQRWDITRKDFNGWDNYVIKRHPLPKWYSEEYKEIQKDADLFELYNYIIEVNDRAKEVGYIQNKGASTFLPFVRKSMAESLAWDFSPSAIKNWGTSLSIDASTVGYGAVNELTGELEHGLPKYYTNDFTREGDETDVSEDLFRNMILYTRHLNKYTYLSAIEGQLKLIKDIETFKKHYSTSIIGEVEFDSNGKPVELAGNEDNAKMFDDFLRGVFYEEKYPLSDTDIPINTGVLNFMKHAVNKVAGKEVFHPDEDASPISVMKTVDLANRAFQLKTLGLESISGAVNAFGGTIQVLTQAGKYFKGGEFISNATKLMGNRFVNNDEREMFIQLIDKFMPLKDDPTYERLQEAGMSALTRANFGDMLMVFMRQPEQHIEKTIFLTLLQNTMVENGKIVSIREHVKAKYKDRYKSAEDYRNIKPQMEEEIKELQKTKSIDATKSLVDGKLVIPGLDLSNTDELQRLTNLTRRISRNATGGVSDSDRNKASMNIWLASMMVFKNWIPKLLATRFSHFEKVADDFSIRIDEDGVSTGEMYDIGRIRLWGYIVGTSIRDKSMNVVNILSMNQQGIELLDKMYVDFADGYRKRTGKEMNMSKEDFNDLIFNNLQNQMKELAMGLSLLSAGLAMGMMTPPEDTDKATKNFYRWSQRVIGKFENELLFFYSPVQFQQMLSGGTFPALGLFTDITRFIDHFIMETTGLDISNPQLTPEEVIKKAQPIKNLARMLPITKPMLTYGAILSSDFAEEFDITVQKESNRK